MQDDYEQMDEVRAQAAEWFARLKTLPVSRDTLEQFFEWRRIKGNAPAFDALEQFWDDSAVVGSNPAIQAATREAYIRPLRLRRGWQPPRWIWATAAAALVACLAIVALEWTRMGQVYVTQVGERSLVTLEDGSKVSLDTDTKLAVRFSQGSRRISLERGQAFFEVAHLANRPFTVEAAGTRVLATGTQFEVRKDVGSIKVTLIEGRVKVMPTPGADETVLTPGQQLQVGKDKPAQVHPIDGNIATAWRRGQIVLDNRTLLESVEEVNRYTTHPIRLQSERSSGQRFSGSFAVGDTESFVSAATALLPIEAKRSGHGDIELVDRAAQ